MRSALAYALAAEGLDDRTIIRTIAWWLACGLDISGAIDEELADTIVTCGMYLHGVCP